MHDGDEKSEAEERDKRASKEEGLERGADDQKPPPPGGGKSSESGSGGNAADQAR